MFRQSITGHILLWLKNAFLQYDASISYRVIMRIANWVKTAFVNSALHRYFTSPSKLEAYYKTSLFYALISKLFEKCLALCAAVVAWFGKISANGFVGRALIGADKRGFLNFEYVSALFFVIMLLVPHDYWNNVYAFIGAVLLAFLYIVKLASQKSLGKDLRAIPISLIAFLLAILAGMLITPVRSDGVRIALFFISSVIFTLVCAGGLSDKKALSTFMHLLLGGLGLLCLFGIFQGIMGVEVNPEFTDVATNEGMPGRVYATLSNPNNFAEVVVLLLPFTYAMFLNTKTKRAKLTWVLVFALCVAALMMSYSRSCYIAFALSTVLFIALYDWRLLLPLGVLAIACIPLLPETVMNRILTIGSMEDTSNASRIYIWEGIIAMLKDHAVTGIGLGPEAFAAIYPMYANRLALTAPHAHMLYLEIFVELGLLGGISFLVFMFSSIKKGLATYNRTDKELRNIIIAAISALGGISFVCAAEYIWFYPRVMFVFWIVVGILLCAVRLAKKDGGNNA